MHRSKWFPAVMLLGFATATLAADRVAVGTVRGTQQKVGMAATDANDYKIGPEDVLDIAVWSNTTVSRTVPVRPDGKISLPLLNDVQAAGLTTAQLRDDLTRKLSEYISKPEVSVIVTGVHSRKVAVIGQVKKAGRFELKSQATVLDLLAQAEGLNEFASRSRIFVLRANGTGTRRVAFNYSKLMDGGDQDNFVLEPGDIVVVP